MTEATITARIEVNDPIKEVVVLTVSDGETYISRKFSTITAVQNTINEDAGLLSIPISCAISGGTVTMHATGLSDLKVCLVIYGRK